jgi:hypothetical protein
MSDVFINKVAESGIITIDLETYLPKEEIVVFDIKDYLFMGLILKEKDFRAALKELSLEKYEQKIVAVTCSADAIIPMWAYMLIASLLQPVCIDVILGTADQVERKLLLQNIQLIDTSAYMDNRVVVKGCGEKPIPEEAYLEITNKLRPVAKSIMFGEPCSTVPVYKKPKE